MPNLERQPDRAAQQDHDVVIVGGGVYGVCLALEAGQRGLKPLLLERDDWGQRTSGQSLRIVHGGLRYLQRLDILRHRESVGERRWFLRHFPDLVEPLPCLMPLYNDGLKRPSAMWGALLLNDLLSATRNQGVRADRHLPRGRVVGSRQVVDRFPSVPTDGLTGGAVWSDAVMAKPQRLFMELLHWATAAGATVLNHCQARDLIVEHGQAIGVEAEDRRTGECHRFRAPRVINAAGPWCRALAESWDRDEKLLFRPSFQFNLMLEVEPLSEAAVAVTAPRPGARTYFLVPWRGRVFAGTHYEPEHTDIDRPEPSAEQIQRFLDALNEAAPGWGLTPDHVSGFTAGHLPADRHGEGEFAHRCLWIDHGRASGPQGLYSMSGVKWTTARLEAARAIKRVWPKQAPPRPPVPRPAATIWPDWGDLTSAGGWDQSRTALNELCQKEQVWTAEDVAYRRTDWAEVELDWTEGLPDWILSP